MSQFYLQDSRSNTGDGLMFWTLGGGCTTNLDKAKLFTQDQARGHRKRRAPASVQNCGGCGRFVPSPSYEDCRHCDHDNRP